MLNLLEVPRTLTAQTITLLQLRMNSLILIPQMDSRKISHFNVPEQVNILLNTFKGTLIEG
jgi:hypothetical protein